MTDPIWTPPSGADTDMPTWLVPGVYGGTVTVTLTDGWFVTVRTGSDGQQIHLGAHDASGLIGALQSALRERRHRNSGQ
ncbi:MAG: hypothetical protein ACRDQ5_11700 [Sciscionella sp.]